MKTKEKTIDITVDNETIIDKLSRIQATLKTPKSQYNAHGGFEYRSCEDILRAVKPLVTSEGLVLTMADEVVTIGTRYYIKATVTLLSNDKSFSISAYARETETRKGMDEAQITGASSSYARKYALNGLFCIDDTKDQDTMDNSKIKINSPVNKPIIKQKSILTSEEQRLSDELDAYSVSSTDTLHFPKNEGEEQDNICPHCNAPMKLSKKTGKLYCSKLCWLKQIKD